MLRFLTSGESHGPQLTAIIEGLPAGVSVSVEEIDKMLARRQGGYGRGGRMKIENDHVEIVSGLRDSFTLGSPLTLQIRNKDWENWQEIMAPVQAAKILERRVTKPRPGHADLAGGLKYHQDDLRNILERASARETAARVAVGAVAKEFLCPFGIKVQAQVTGIGSVHGLVESRIYDDQIFSTPLYCPDSSSTEAMIKAIDQARENGDSLGGTFQIVVEGLPPGLGSHVQWDRRLDGLLAQALMSIPAIKGVEIGLGFISASLPGSVVHDEIMYRRERGYYHSTNRAGGLEGGMTNGETIVLRAAMKPIPTLTTPMQSVDMETKIAAPASVERSDVCAVPAASVVGEACAAWVIAVSLLEKFGGDHLDECRESYFSYLEYLKTR